MAQSLLGNEFLECGHLTKKSQVDYSEVQLIGIYFSAHWCPPCRKFTPVLAEFYNQVNSNGKKFEVVFCSCDNTQSEFEEYTSMMPWKALPFKDSKIDTLAEKFKVTGIPRLIIVRPDGTIANNNARADVQGTGPDAFEEWLSKK